MSGFTIYYADGGYTEFPDAHEAEADAVVTWFHKASDGDVIRLGARGQVIHAVRRHVTRIAVAR